MDNPASELACALARRIDRHHRHSDIPSGTSKLLRLHNFHQADISVLAQIDPSAQCRKRLEKLRLNFKQNPPGFDDLQGRG